jgi:hypothetical protein
VKHVIGRLDYAVTVTCPHCKNYIHLEHIEDDENLLGKAVFGGIEKPATWKNIEIDYTCPKCFEEFQLIEIEY